MLNWLRLWAKAGGAAHAAASATRHARTNVLNILLLGETRPPGSLVVRRRLLQAGVGDEVVLDPYLRPGALHVLFDLPARRARLLDAALFVVRRIRTETALLGVVVQVPAQHD